MTNKARELLEATLDHLHGMNSYEDCLLKNRIRAYLAESEVKPLNEKEINRELPINCSGDYSDGFNDGVIFAERHHRIGGEND